MVDVFFRQGLDPEEFFDKKNQRHSRSRKYYLDLECRVTAPKIARHEMVRVARS